MDIGYTAILFTIDYQTRVSTTKLFVTPRATLSIEYLSSCGQSMTRLTLRKTAIMHLASYDCRMQSDWSGSMLFVSIKLINLSAGHESQ